MKERIDIEIPEGVLELNEEKAQRLRTVRIGKKADRVPVMDNFNQFTLLAARESSFKKYIASPADNLKEQILNMKWKWEHLRTDAPIPTERITFGPDIGCLRGVEFEMEIKWVDGESPKCTYPLTFPEQIDDLDVPAPDQGLNAMYIEWCEDMEKAAAAIDLRLNGKPLEIQISWGQVGGPIPAAFALCGENMLMWMLTDPDRMHRLMAIVTESHINCVRFFDDMFGRKRTDGGFGMGCDTAEMLSPDMYRQFVVPYYTKVYETFPGRRGLHMCGCIDHLLEIIRDELKISSLNGFGFPTDRNRLAEVMAGNTIMSGGPNVMLIRKGPIAAIKAECRSYIETVGSEGGYILQPGGGTPPGTPIEHIHAMLEAAKEAAGLRPEFPNYDIS